MKDLFDGSDATALAGAIRTGQVSAREVVAYSLERIEERNPTLNAITEQRAEAALADADVAVGPLAGVPFVIKDLNVDVAGMRSTGGSRLRADVVATEDSTIVQRYRRAGLVIVGTTNVPEFGRNGSTEPQLSGPTRNPHRLSHSPGGSSGGTAAAVAAAIVPAGHGNDGGGSLRIPAAACGLVGLKPSRGRTPAHPRLNTFSYPMGINHAITRTVRDCALLLDVAAGAVAGDAFALPAPARGFLEEVAAPPGRLRIAVSASRPDGGDVHPEAVAATLAAGRLLASLGHDVEEVTPAYPLEAVQEAMRVVMAVPLAAEIDARLAVLGRPLREDDLEPFTHVLYGMAKAVTGTELVHALQATEQAGLLLGAFFAAHDVLVTPTLPVPPPPLGLLDTTNPASMYEHAGAISSLTAFCNVTGQPAISLPLARYGDGLPLGIQLVAANGRDDLLLRLASQVEEAQPWPVAPVWPAYS